jgi:hypothetical protein
MRTPDRTIYAELVFTSTPADSTDFDRSPSIRQGMRCESDQKRIEAKT